MVLKLDTPGEESRTRVTSPLGGMVRSLSAVEVLDECLGQQVAHVEIVVAVCGLFAPEREIASLRFGGKQRRASCQAGPEIYTDQNKI